MGFGLSVLSPPATEPLSLTELKAWLRVDIDDDDDLIASLGKAARRLVESTYDAALVTRTLQMVIDRFPLPGSPYLWQQYGYGYTQGRIPSMQLTGSWWPERAAIWLPRPPLLSVLSVVYIDASGATQTQDPATYLVDAVSRPGRITPAVGSFWPIVSPRINAVTISYQAGYGDASAVPDTVKTSMKMMAAHWYENRESVNIGNIVSTIPMGAAALLASEWGGEYY